MRAPRVVAPLFALASLSACEQPRVILAVTAARAVFVAGQTISLDVSIANQGTGAVGIASQLDGAIRVAAMTKDGVPVVSPTARIRFDDNLDFALERSLRSTAPGTRVAFAWTSSPDRTHGQVLRTVTAAPDGQHTATFFPVGAAGRYRMVVEYRYPGSRGAFRRVVAGPVTDTVSFTVAP